jgi:uncharacterized protein YqgV (UPF0045/DUF77 family)
VPLRVEFTVEPFVAGSPGAHVQAAIDAARARGIDIDFGPFGSAFVDDEATVLAAVDAVLRAAIAAGATRVSYQVSRVE